MDGLNGLVYCFHVSYTWVFWRLSIAYEFDTSFFVFVSTAPLGPGPPHSRGLLITHNDTSHSVRLLWTSDQPVAETLPENTQYSQQTNNHATGGILTHNLSRRAGVDLRLIPRGHWDRLVRYVVTLKLVVFLH